MGACVIGVMAVVILVLLWALTVGEQGAEQQLAVENAQMRATIQAYPTRTPRPNCGAVPNPVCR